MIASIDINWEALGAEFGRCDDQQQADFFKGFARELCLYPARHHCDMQMCAINAKLKSHDKETLKAHLPGIWFKEGDE